MRTRDGIAPLALAFWAALIIGVALNWMVFG